MLTMEKDNDETGSCLLMEQIKKRGLVGGGGGGGGGVGGVGGGVGGVTKIKKDSPEPFIYLQTHECRTWQPKIANPKERKE